MHLSPGRWIEAMSKAAGLGKLKQLPGLLAVTLLALVSVQLAVHIPIISSTPLIDAPLAKDFEGLAAIVLGLVMYTMGGVWDEAFDRLYSERYDGDDRLVFEGAFVQTDGRSVPWLLPGGADLAGDRKRAQERLGLRRNIYSRAREQVAHADLERIDQFNSRSKLCRYAHPPHGSRRPSLARLLRLADTEVVAPSRERHFLRICGLPVRWVRGPTHRAHASSLPSRCTCEKTFSPKSRLLARKRSTVIAAVSSYGTLACNTR